MRTVDETDAADPTPHEGVHPPERAGGLPPSVVTIARAQHGQRQEDERDQRPGCEEENGGRADQENAHPPHDAKEACFGCTCWKQLSDSSTSTFS